MTTRRSILKSILAIALVPTGLLISRIAKAAWPEKAFASKQFNNSLDTLLGSHDLTASEAITLKMPDIAQNGAVVPVTVSVGISEITQIIIMVEGNPYPLAANFKFSANAESFISTRIKMMGSSHVHVIAKSGKILYSTKKYIEVVEGGCN